MTMTSQLSLEGNQDRKQMRDSGKVSELMHWRS